MHRRELVALLAGTLAVPEELMALGRAVHRRARASTLRALNVHQDETVATIAELIIPETDTPGARAAGVPAFIEVILAEWADDADRQRVVSGLASVDQRSNDLFGKNFTACAPPQQAQILTALDAEVARLRDTGAKPSQHFFYVIKRLTLIGYYTSEAGATAEQHYQIIPGRYEPCYPLES